jgi:hypothetical protein
MKIFLFTLQLLNYPREQIFENFLAKTFSSSTHVFFFLSCVAGGVLSYLSKYKILIKNKMAGVCHAIGNELTLFILFEWCVQRIMMVDHSLPRHFLIASTSSFLCNIVYVMMVGV